MKRAMKPSRSRYVASLGQRWRWMAGSAKVTDKQPGSELLPPTTRAIGTDTHSFSNTCNVVCPAWGRPFTESIDWYQNHHLNHSFRGIILRKITVVMNWRATLTVANMSFFEGKVTLVVWEPVRHYLSVTAINFADHHQQSLVAISNCHIVYGINRMLPCKRARPDGSEYVWQRRVFKAEPQKKSGQKFLGTERFPKTALFPFLINLLRSID